MRKIWTIAHYEYVRQVWRRGFLLTTLGVPLLIAGVIGAIVLVASTTEAERRLGLVDQSGRFGAVDMQALDLDQPIPTERYADEAAARRAFDAVATDAYVVVPADYLQTGAVRAVTRQPLSDRAENQVEALLRAGILDAAPPANRALLDDPAELTLATGNSGREVSSDNVLLFLLPYVFALIFMLTTFTTSGILLQAIAEEKEDRVMEILATTLSPWQMMAGKVVGLSGVGLTVVASWLGLIALAVASFASDWSLFRELELPWGILSLALLFFVFGYLLIAACYAMAGAVVNTPQEAQPLVTPISLLGVAPLMLVSVILAEPNGTLAVVFSLIPFSAPITMLMRLPLAAVPSWQVGASLLIVAGSAVGAVLLSGRVLRANMLRVGQRPRLRELLGRG